MSTDPLERCIQQLARFPGIGQRTATRLSYWLVRQEPHVAAEIASAMDMPCTARTRTLPPPCVWGSMAFGPMSATRSTLPA